VPISLDPQQVTLVTVLFAIGAAGLRRLWVFGWTYADKVIDLAEMTKDRNFWRDMALNLLETNDKAIEVAAKGTRNG
jgi:hypothetical protein